MREFFTTWGPHLTWLFFVMAWGACAGSLINVLVYRMPRGLSVITPPSRCPHCNTRLTWRENIPIFGWLILRGRCRFCKAPISPEYPIVEAITSTLFGLAFVICFMLHPTATWLGVPIGAIRPEWALNWPEHVWPIFVVWLILLASLIAMTLVDAKTFTIPIELAWAPTLVALIAHPAAAAWIEYGTRIGHLMRSAGPIWVWGIATPKPTDWWWIGASIGGTVGIGVAVLLLQTGLLTRSYADYEEWERKAIGVDSDGQSRDTQAPSAAAASNQDTHAPLAVESLETQSALADKPHPSTPPAQSREPSTPDTTPLQADTQPPPQPIDIGWRWMLIPAAMFATSLICALIARTQGVAPGYGAFIGALIGVLPGAALWRATHKAPADTQATDDSPVHTWIAYPHARREALREAVFLAPCLALGLLGGYVAQRLGTSIAPLWLTVLAGVLMGYLIGGGIVWAVRILGSVALGKEAMGLGDVHLLAAIGACLGWIDAVLTFFLASFVALYWTLLRRLMFGGFSRAMPFGPNLAVAAILVIGAKPWIERGLTILLASPIPVNIP